MILAVDVGGSKTLMAVFEDKKIVFSKKFATAISYKRFLEDFKNVYSKLSQPIDQIAIGVPGRIDRSSGLGLVFPNLKLWQNVPLISDFAELTGLSSSDIILENDAKLAAFGQWCMFDEYYQNLLYVTISTGLGFGLVKSGQIDISTDDLGGASLMLDYGGQTISWEGLSSGKTILETYHKMAVDINEPAIWEQISEKIYAGLGIVIKELKPQAVTFGGSVGVHFEKFGGFLRVKLKADQAISQKPVLLKAKHPEEAVIYGCYYYAKTQLSKPA